MSDEELYTLYFAANLASGKDVYQAECDAQVALMWHKEKWRGQEEENDSQAD